MKKFFALLTMCTLLVGTTTTAFAADVEAVNCKQTENSVIAVDNAKNAISARNIDYWNTYGPLAISNTVINVTPGKGENLKIHLYLYSNNSITIKVAPAGGSWRTVTTWNSTGDHWADLVRGTNGGTYSVKIEGSTVADGGIYSE